MTAPSLEAPETLHGLIEELARVEPNRVALREDGRETTFDELWARAGDLAGALVAKGVSRGDVVAVAMPRSTASIVACFAVLRAGGTVLALDLHLPTLRNRKQIEAAQVRWSLIEGSVIPECVAGTISIDAATKPPANRMPDPQVRAADIGFLVYTSGSSGEPKGVLLSHGALVARSEAEIAAYEFTPADSYLLRTSPAFIGWSVALEILAKGIPLVVARDGAGEDMVVVARLIRDERITFTGLPPRLIELILVAPEAAKSLSSLRVLRSSGEALPTDLAHRVHALLPACRLVDGYGTTEAGGVITTADVLGSDDSGSEGSAGTALPGVTLRLIARDGSVSATEGELWVATAMLASGYLGGEATDDPKFVEAMFDGDQHPRRWYRTGDRARFTPDGRLVVLGRLDVQLNVDGVRVDPVEIENALRLHESVADAAVWTHVDDEGRSRLIAYIVDRDPSASARSATLRGFLASSLPPSLIPARFVRLTALPITPSGKVDRKVLPKPAMSGPAVHLGPRNAMESTLLPIFRDILGAPELGVADDFFEWGGDSLKAFALMTKVFEATAVRLPAATILNAPTVEDLAKEIGLGDQGQVTAVWLRKEGDLAPLVCLPGLAGDPLWFFPLIEALDPRQPILGLSFVGLKPPITITEAASLAVKTLRAVQPRGPYSLLGHSLGGVLAFEMARELKGLGEAVVFLGLIDTFVLGVSQKAPTTAVARLTHRLTRFRNHMIGKAKHHLRAPMSILGVVIKPRVTLFVAGLKDAGRRHRILPGDLRITLFRANERSVNYDLARDWAPLARGGVEIVDIPGHHFNLITGGRAKVLSALVAEAVKRSTSSPEGSSSR